MIVKQVVGKDSEGYSWLELRVNGSSVVSAYALCECPEDATLERDLSYVYEFTELMKRAYEAGKNSEEFEIVYVDESKNK